MNRAVSAGGTTSEVLLQARSRVLSPPLRCRCSGRPLSFEHVPGASFAAPDTGNTRRPVFARCPGSRSMKCSPAKCSFGEDVTTGRAYPAESRLLWETTPIIDRNDGTWISATRTPSTSRSSTGRTPRSIPDAVAVSERGEPRPLDGGDVREDVLRAVLRRDEPVALVGLNDLTVPTCVSRAFGAP